METLRVATGMAQVIAAVLAAVELTLRCALLLVELVAKRKHRL